MKVKVYISPDEEIGPLTDKEKAALAKLREHFTDYELPDERINSSMKGWNHSACLGSSRIFSDLIAFEDADETRPLGRLQAVVYPWVPPGEVWPWPENNTDHYHVSWKIDFRAMEPLDVSWKIDFRAMEPLEES